MTDPTDALPLPVPTHFRNGVLYAFSADQIRADREMVWELAMRKAQKGRGPVVLPDGIFDALSDLLGDSNMAERVHRLITSWCDTSPPPKSDEARRLASATSASLGTRRNLGPFGAQFHRRQASQEPPSSMTPRLCVARHMPGL